MNKPANKGCVKCAQRDYSLSFKLQSVEEIGWGFLTRSQARDKYGIQTGYIIIRWLKKHGNFD